MRVMGPDPDTIWLVLPWSPQLGAGVSVVVSALARALSARHLNPAVVITDWTATGLRAGPDGYWRFKFSVIGLFTASALLRAAIALPFRLTRIVSVLRRHRVGSINFHYVGLDALGVALLKRLRLYGGRLVLSFHGTDIRTPASGLERRLWRFLLSSADALTTCSASLARTLIETHGDVCRAAVVIHNGVDTDLFRPLPATEVAAGAGRYIASVGSYIPRKGHRTLFEAFASLASAYPDLRLVIIGQDGAERASLMALAAAAKLATRVDCRVDQPPEAVAAALAGAAVSVQPSRAEPFGIAIIEAGACGIPIVASAVGGHLELLAASGGEQTGYLFDAGDAGQCAAMIRRVLDDPDEAAIVARRFRQLVVTRYTWAACADRYAQASGSTP